MHPIKFKFKIKHDPEYKKKNPQGQVPCLFIDGTYLSQSVNKSISLCTHHKLLFYLFFQLKLAIIEYIEETRPNGKSLFPKDPIKRAKARAIAEIVNSGMQPLQAGPVLRNLDQEKRKDFLQHFFTKGFNAIEEILKQTSGKYCIDDEVTIADICLVSIILNANFNKVSIDEYPLVNRINEELSKLPEYKASHPSAQPDCPPDYK